MNPQTKLILDGIEGALRSGALTVTNKIDDGTFLILTQKLPNGLMHVWHGDYDTMGELDKLKLKGKVKGDTVDVWRVATIFDRWA
jgi:hypothetical protein